MCFCAKLDIINAKVLNELMSCSKSPADWRRVIDNAVATRPEMPPMGPAQFQLRAGRLTRVTIPTKRWLTRGQGDALNQAIAEAASKEAEAKARLAMAT